MNIRDFSRIAVSTSKFRSGFLLAVLALVIFSNAACSKEGKTKSITLATTTSVDDSGLLNYLKPEFTKDTGIDVRVVAQGTGQAVKTAEGGNADVLLIHDKKSEEKFVSSGNGVKRIELMYNYFVVAGPKDDPAHIRDLTSKDAVSAFKRIMEEKPDFVSRGDDSGTHKKELSIWKTLNMEPKGDWYISSGKGMGPTLTMASEKKAYTLTDKATFLSMKDKLDLDIVLEGAKDLLNQYTLIAVSGKKHPAINEKGAKEFIDWMTSKKAVEMINEFGREKYGEGLFIVNYIEGAKEKP